MTDAGKGQEGLTVRAAAWLSSPLVRVCCGLGLAMWMWLGTVRPWGPATWACLTAALVGWLFVAPTGEVRPGRARHVGWLALLPAATWLGMIWLFWPGILSPDSIEQLGQARTGQFSEWQPVGHTLMLLPFERLGLPPAAYLICQVLACALVVAMAFRHQVRSGVPVWGIVLSAGALAVSPPLLFMFATLWRDVTYGAFLVLAGMALAAHGARWRLPLLALSLFGVMLARLNGPLVVGTLLLMALLVRALRPKQIALLAVGLVAAFGVLKGPIYAAWGVERKAADFVILAHHVAAHLDAGTPFTPEELQLIAPISRVEGGWRYTCWSAFPTTFSPAFDLEAARQRRPDLMRLVVALTWRHPSVAVRNVACLSRIAWAFEYADAWLYRTEARTTPQGLHYVLDNGLGYTQQSPRPDLALRLVQWQEGLPTYVWAPGTYLFLIVVALAGVVGRRAPGWPHLAWVLPLAAHAITLAAVNMAFESRYGFPVLFGALVWAPGLLALAIDARVRVLGSWFRGTTPP